MPTYEKSPRFLRDWDSLTPLQQAQFFLALAKFIEDLRGDTFRCGLRVKRYHGLPGAWEITWAPDGRALFRFGATVRAEERHIIWLRIGTHDIFDAR